MNKEITKCGAIKLLTAGKRCAEDIMVTPKLQTIEAKENYKRYTPESGYAGFSSVNVNIEANSMNVTYNADDLPDWDHRNNLWICADEPSMTEFTTKKECSILGYFTLSAALPYRMRHHPVARVGTKIYVFGSSAYPKKSVHIFDIETNEVTTKELAYDYSFDEGQAVAIGTLIYILIGTKTNGGYYMYEYDTETNLLTQKKYFTAGQSSAMIEFGGSIYTIGGKATNDVPHKYVYRYDPPGNAIITVGTLTNTLYKACSVSYGRYIYAFGGQSYQNSSYVPQLKVIRINVDTSEIVELDAAFTEEVYDMVALKLGKDIYLMGSYGKAASVYHFDAETETLDQTPLSGIGFVNQTGVRGVQYGNVLYCLGGGLNSAASNSGIGKFVGMFPLDAGKITVLHGDGGIPFKLIDGKNQTTIDVRHVYKGNADGQAELCDAYVHDGNAWIDVNTKETFL